MTEQATEVVSDTLIPEASQPTEPSIVAEAVKAVEPEQPKPSASDYAKFKAKADRLRQQEAEYKGYQTEAAKYRAELEELKGLAKNDPVAAAERLGLNYDELIYRLSGAADTPEAKLQRELAQIKQQLSQREERERVQSEEQHWADTFEDFSSVVTKDDTLQMLQAELESEPDTVLHTLKQMERISRERGTPLTYEQAAQQYEDYLYERAQRYASKPKLRDWVTPKQPAPLKTEEAKIPAESEPAAKNSESKTLNNNVSSEPVSVKRPREGLTPRQLAILDEQERMEEIVRKLQAGKR